MDKRAPEASRKDQIFGNAYGPFRCGRAGALHRATQALVLSFTYFTALKIAGCLELVKNGELGAEIDRFDRRILFRSRP
jgi:hypothetical protein